MLRPNTENIVAWAIFQNRRRNAWVKAARALSKSQESRYPFGFNKTQECARRRRQVEHTCTTCRNRDGGVCSDCAGENFGHTTEVSPKFMCANWK